LGEHTLRGIAEPCEVFGLPDDLAGRPQSALASSPT
jgi:hypothetical protein